MFRRLAEALPKLDRPEAARARRILAERLHASGTSPEAARRLAVLPELVIVPDVAALARASGSAALVAAGAFFEVSDRLGIDRLLARVRRQVSPDAWAAAARRGLLDDLVALRRDATAAALRVDATGDLETPDDGRRLAERWLAGRSVQLAEATLVRRRVEEDADAGLEAVVVAVRALRRVVS